MVDLPDKQYFKIGEVAQLVGVKPHVLRYWEREFRLFRPEKSKSNHRVYSRRDVEIVATIKQLLYEQRYTISGARTRLRQLLREYLEPSTKRNERAAPPDNTSPAEPHQGSLFPLDKPSARPDAERPAPSGGDSHLASLPIDTEKHPLPSGADEGITDSALRRNGPTRSDSPGPEPISASVMALQDALSGEMDRRLTAERNLAEMRRKALEIMSSLRQELVELRQSVARPGPAERL